MVAVTTTAVATATTTTTATTATAAVMVVDSVAALGVVAVVLLIALLITKELASASDHPRAQRLSRLVNVGLAPLAMAFTVIVGTKVWAILA